MQTVQALGLASTGAGLAPEFYSQALNSLNSSLSEAKGQRALSELQISARDSYGELRKGPELLAEVAAAIGKIEDPALRASQAVRLFGESGTTYIPQLNDELRRNLATINDWGLVLDKTTQGHITEFKSDVDSLGASFRGLKGDISLSVEYLKSEFVGAIGNAYAAIKHFDFKGLIPSFITPLSSSPDSRPFGSGTGEYDFEGAKNNSNTVGLSFLKNDPRVYLQGVGNGTSIYDSLLAATSRDLLSQRSPSGPTGLNDTNNQLTGTVAPLIAEYKKSKESVEAQLTSAKERLDSLRNAIDHDDKLISKQKEGLFIPATEHVLSARERSRALDDFLVQSRKVSTLTAQKQAFTDREDATKESERIASLLQNKQRDSARSAREAALGSRGAVVQGFNTEAAEIDQVLQTRKRDLDKYSTFVDSKSGEERRITLEASTRFDIEQKTNNEILGIHRKFELERAQIALDAFQRVQESRKAGEDAQLARSSQAFGDSEKLFVDASRRREEFETGQLTASRDHQLRQVETVFAQSTAQKLGLEQKKLAIEEDYLQRSLNRNIEVLKQRSEVEILDAQKGIEDKDALDVIRLSRESVLQSKIAVLRGDTQDKLQAAADTAQVRNVQIVRDQFESIKRSAESLLDQLFSHTNSWAQTFGNILKAAILTPVKQAASTLIASVLTGQRVAFGAEGGGASISSGRGILGAIGLGGGGGLGGIFGGGGSQTPTGIFGPIAQPTFPGGGLGSSVSGSQAGGSVGKFGSVGGLFGSLKGSLSQLGNIGMPSGVGDTWGSTSSAGLFGGKGVGGAKGGALLAGGAILAYDGLRRGGKLGLLETTAGGAAIGYKFGGPVGAAIGAAVGAAAGFIRLFIHGAIDKCIDKIKSLYGLSISKDFASRIVDTAKQNFGGDLELAIRSPQVRDLLELYAMSTGQKWAGAPSAPTPVSLYQSSGSVFQVPAYRNGVPGPSLGGSIPSITMPSSSSGQMNVTLQLDPDATRQVLQGQAAEVISNNPRLVQSATVSATQQSSGRREMAALTLSPG